MGRLEFIRFTDEALSGVLQETRKKGKKHVRKFEQAFGVQGFPLEPAIRLHSVPDGHLPAVGASAVGPGGNFGGASTLKAYCPWSM
jgi:hypothetical protein